LIIVAKHCNAFVIVVVVKYIAPSLRGEKQKSHYK